MSPTEGKIPSATSAADVAVTWASGTQLAYVALPRRLTWDSHADVATDVVTQPGCGDTWPSNDWNTRLQAWYEVAGLGTRWQVRMAAREARIPKPMNDYSRCPRGAL
ncbi:hypothetical protein Tco_1444764 [Tanacetum coccineum]